VLVRGGVAADNAHLDASSILILQGAASIDNVNFKAQDSAMQLSQFAYILNSNLVNTNATAGVPSGILLFDAPAGTAHQITGNIGANDQRLSSIIFNADNTLTLNAAVAPGVFVDRINTKVANTGTLQINQGPNVTITSDIGMLAMPFGAVNILGDGVAGPATGPTNVTLAANKAIYAAIDLGALQNNLIFEDSTTITGNITAQAPSNNDLTFEGTTLITGNIGTGNKMKQLIMNKGSKVLVTGDVAASKASLAEESKLTLKGAAAINIDSVHFEAQDSTMQLSGISSTLTGNLVNEGTARNSRGVLLTGDVAGIEHKIAGDVGGANQHLFGIYFGADNTLTLRPGGVAGVASNPGVFVDYIATDATGNGTIQVSQGADVTIHSNIGTEVPASAATGNDILPAYALKAVNIIDDGAGGVTNVTLTANKAIHAKTISLGVINNKLTLKDGTSITGNIVTSTPSKGTLTFDKGAVSTITGEIGTSNKISEINVGEGSTVTVTGSVSADNSYLANDSQLILQGAAIDIGTVQTNNDKQGTLTFKGGDQVFTGSLGVAGSQLKTVEFASGGNVRLDLTAPVNVESLSFTTADDSQITINKDLSATNITTVSEAKNQDFLISAMQSITGEVGSAQHPLGDFILNDSIIVLNTPTFHAGIATDTAGKGSATLTQIPEGIRDIGTNDKPLLHVTLGVNNNDVTNIYANTILISGDLRLNPSTLSCNTLLVSAPVLPNISVTINVRDGEITAPILSKADNTTNIVFNGDVTLSENVGSNTVINGFAAAKMRQITFNRNITLKDSIDLYSTNIVFNNINDANLKRDLIFAEGVSGKTVNFHGNSAMINYNITTGQNTIAFDGQASLTNSTMSANGGKITFNNELVAKSSAISIDAGSSIEFSGGETSTFTGTTPITVSYNNNAVGAIIADGTGTIVDFTGVADDSTITISAVGAGRISGTYSIIQNNNGGVVNLGKNFTYNTDPFSKWELVDASTGTFLVKDTAGAVTRQILKVANASSASDTNAQVFADLSADLTAGALFDELLEVGRIDKVAMIEAYERISHNTVVVTAEATKSATAQVTARIGDGSNALINQDDSIVNPQSAPAAGERDVLRYGIWGNPIYGQGVQKQRKGMSGYKTKSSGITVGFDTMANDTMLVGVAATAARTDIKHKNVNSGDRSRGNTLLFSIYGLQLVNDKFFVQGVASLGTTKVKNSSTRVGYANGAITRDSVSGNYDSMSWGGELMAGFNVNSFGLGNMTPMLGMDYNRVTDAGFKETGSRNQNFTIYSKPVESLRAIAGVKAVVFSTNYNNMYVTPEVHAFIKQGLVNKNPAMAISLDGTPVVVNNAKPTKTSYNLGASLNTTNGMMQYGITYDANIAQKYVGHQGSVKLRMNF
ncbi:MAG: autotransporter domain-containing protein, partial [Janthinobacterium lividum]